jgi:hypothetical protein
VHIFYRSNCVCNSNHVDNMVREVHDKMLSFLFACCPTVFACAGCPINDVSIFDNTFTYFRPYSLDGFGADNRKRWFEVSVRSY